MLSQAAQHYPVVLDTFAEASSALGYDLWSLVSEGPEDKLTLTEFTQPAILTASVALSRCWREEGGATPEFVAGHSLGEYSALVVAESLSLQDAARLVQTRGRAMQSAVPAGEVIARLEVLGINMPWAAMIGTTSIEVRLPGMPPIQCLSTTSGSCQMRRVPVSAMAWVR